MNRFSALIWAEQAVEILKQLQDVPIKGEELSAHTELARLALKNADIALSPATDLAAE